VTALKGLVFDIQRFSVHDGPGIRTLVFLKGCPLRCLWCDNPEGQAPAPELVFRQSLCIGCGACVPACPRGALHLEDTALRVERDLCDLCGQCVQVCSPQALSIAGRWMSVGEVLSEVGRDRVFYDTSTGGMTVSGGEPLGQPRFLEALLRAAKAERISTTLETSGHAPWPSLERVMRWTDLVLYDIKHADPAAHRRLTGVSNELILENARRIAGLGVPMVVRCPIVPGLTDDLRDLRSLFQFVADLPGVKELHLLPYHRLGEPKYTMLGRQYGLKGTQPPTPEAMPRLSELARAQGLRTRLVT
jgi:pyruvate formate lyase activating enzyme